MSTNIVITHCIADTGFEREAREEQRLINVEIGHSTQSSYTRGDYPIDWAAVQKALVRLQRIVDRAIEHRRECRTCKENAEHGYREVEF